MPGKVKKLTAVLSLKKLAFKSFRENKTISYQLSKDDSLSIKALKDKLVERNKAYSSVAFIQRIIQEVIAFSTRKELRHVCYLLVEEFPSHVSFIFETVLLKYPSFDDVITLKNYIESYRHGLLLRSSMNEKEIEDTILNFKKNNIPTRLNNPQWIKNYLFAQYFFDRFIEEFPEYFKEAFEKFILPRHFADMIEDKCNNIERFRSQFKLSEEKTIEIMTQAIEELSKRYKEISQCKDYLLDILKMNQSCYQNAEKFSFVLGMISLILNPYEVDQGNRNLCGPAAFVSMLLTWMPWIIVKATRDLLIHGEAQIHELKIKGSQHSMKNDYGFSAFFLNAIKNSENILGYNPHYFERFLGVTPPKTLSKWLKQSGFHNITEACFLRDSSGKNEVAYSHRNFLGGLYASDHKDFQNNTDRLNDAIHQFNSGKKLIMMVDALFAHETNVPLSGMTINKDVIASRLEKKRISDSQLLGVQLTHYVMIQDLKLDSQTRELELTIYNYGKLAKITIDQDVFLQHYRGFIAAEPPQYILKCGGTEKMESELKLDRST